jgi:hypothetical protein
MSFQPVEGVLETILKVADVDEAAAGELVRYALYESLTDQIAAARPRLEQDVLQIMAKRAAETRRVVERQEIAKAHRGDTSGPNAQVELGLDIIDAYIVSKGVLGELVGTALAVFNREHKRNARGEFVRNGTNQDGSTAARPSPYGAMDGMAAFTGYANTKMRDKDGNVPDQGANGNAGEWNRPGSPGDRLAYRRMDLTGQALRQASTEGSTAHHVGVAASLIGNVGPEAEKVLGPGIRRTAYRYRGTERQPDKFLVSQVRDAGLYAERMSDDTPEATDFRDELKNSSTAKGVAEPAQGAAIHWAGDAHTMMGEDQLALTMRGDTAALQLMDKIPNAKLAEISIAAGELPPSQGVIIDADGDVTSQAQGFNGDHYVPFDLRNLKDLHGGQYVRTRVAGGPTTEDIYTGLMSGAREVQVISNSGVFTLEFDPSIRGGRRYSDKARRMIDRYGKLLEAIDGGGLFDQDINATERGRLRTKAYSDMNWDPEKGSDRFKVLLAQSRMQGVAATDTDPGQAGTISGTSEEDLYEEAVAETNQYAKDHARSNKHITGRDYADKVQQSFEDKVAEANSTKVRQMVLDGQGYGKALKTLQQEFPFYIRDARHESLYDFASARGAKVPEKIHANTFARDSGYVQPGQTNARASFRRTMGEDKKMHVSDGRRVDTRTKQTRDNDAARNNPTSAPGAAGAVTGRPAGSSGSGSGLINHDPQPADTSVYGNVVIPLVADTQQFSELTGPGSQAEAELTKALNSTMDLMADAHGAGILGKMEAASASEDIHLGGTATGYAQHRISAYPETKTGAGLAKWLLRDAGDEKRSKFLAGWKQATRLFLDYKPGKPGTVAESNYNQIQFRINDGGGEAAFRKKTEAVSELAALAAPFAAKLADDPVEARPDDNEGKPQPFDSIVRMGNQPLNYGAYAKEAQTADPALYQVLLEGNDGPALRSKIEDHLQALHGLRAAGAGDDQIEQARNNLNALQQAWSFTVARDIADKLKPAAPAGSGAGRTPLAVPPAGAAAPQGGNRQGGAGNIRSHQRREKSEPLDGHTGVSGQKYAGKKPGPVGKRLVFHPISEEYSQAVLKAFGMQ